MNLEDIILSEMSRSTRQALDDSTYPRYLEQSNSQRHKGEWWLARSRQDQVRREPPAAARGQSDVTCAASAASSHAVPAGVTPQKRREASGR